MPQIVLVCDIFPPACQRPRSHEFDVVVSLPDDATVSHSTLLAHWSSATVDRSRCHDAAFPDAHILADLAAQLRDESTVLFTRHNGHVSVRPTAEFLTNERLRHDIDVIELLREAQLVAPDATRNSDVIYGRSGAVETFELKSACASAGCKFPGSQAGHCSTHWKALDLEQKRAANASSIAVVLEKLGTKQQRQEAEAAAEAERAAARKRRAEDDLRALADAEARAAAEVALAKTEGRCFSEPAPELEQTPLPDGWATFSCGVAPVDAAHAAHTGRTWPALSDAAAQITRTLSGVEEGSSDGGEPFVGFFCLRENVAALRRAVGGASKSGKRMTAGALFPRFAEREADVQAKFERVLTLLRDELGCASFLRVAPKSDSIGGGIICAGITTDGDLVGARCFVVWT
jgi:hypothetical protein